MLVGRRHQGAVGDHVRLDRRPARRARPNPDAGPLALVTSICDDRGGDGVVDGVQSTLDAVADASVSTGAVGHDRMRRRWSAVEDSAHHAEARRRPAAPMIPATMATVQIRVTGRGTMCSGSRTPDRRDPSPSAGRHRPPARRRLERLRWVAPQPIVGRQPREERPFLLQAVVGFHGFEPNEAASPVGHRPAAACRSWPTGGRAWHAGASSDRRSIGPVHPIGARAASYRAARRLGGADRRAACRWSRRRPGSPGPTAGPSWSSAGTVRDHAEGRPGVVELEYEAYAAQVEPRLAAIAERGPVAVGPAWAGWSCGTGPAPWRSRSAPWWWPPPPAIEATPSTPPASASIP